MTGNLAASVEKLTKDLDQCRSYAVQLRIRHKHEVDMVRSLWDEDTKKLIKAKEALRFYANPEIYVPHPHGVAFERSDKGHFARAILEILEI